MERYEQLHTSHTRTCKRRCALFYKFHIYSVKNARVSHSRAHTQRRCGHTPPNSFFFQISTAAAATSAFQERESKKKVERLRLLSYLIYRTSSLPTGVLSTSLSHSLHTHPANRENTKTNKTAKNRKSREAILFFCLTELRSLIIIFCDCYCPCKPPHQQTMNFSGTRGLCTLWCFGLFMLLLSSEVHGSVIMPMRQQRGFKNNVSNRIAHGFGKRTSQDSYYLASSLDDRKNLITPRKLAELIMYDKNLAYTVALKLDANDDGVISTNELTLKEYI